MDFLTNLIIGGLIAASIICYLVIAISIWFHFPDRSAEDVVDFLSPVDLEKAMNLLDPVAESWLRRDYSPREFRRLQRKRIYHYLEIVYRMSRNAAILIQWAHREEILRNGQITPLAEAIQQHATRVRAYALLSWLKVHFWLLIRIDNWHLLPTPSLADMREVCGVRGIEAYDALKTAASRLFLEVNHGNGRFEQLLQNL